VSTGHAYRAFETTDDTGTGTFKDLDGPVAGFQEIVGALKDITGIGTGPWSAEITIENVTLGGGDWEAWECNVEEGTGAGGKDRVRFDTGTLKESSNSDAAVAWGSGVKNVFIAPSAKKGYALFDALTTVGVVKRLSAESYSVLPTGAIGEALLDDADAATARATIGAVIGANVQAWDADLDTIAALAKTSGNVIRGTGSAWASAALASADVSHTPVAPLTGTTVDAALDELAYGLSAVTTQSTAHTSANFTTETALNDLSGLTIPNLVTPFTKKYRCSGIVTVTGVDLATTAFIVRVRVGTAGTTADAEKFRLYEVLPFVAGTHSMRIPDNWFVPASGEKVTITLELLAGDTSINTVAAYTRVQIEQIRNA